MNVASIPALFREQVAKLQSRPMVYGKVDRHWRPLTWAQMGERAAHAAAGLCALGLAAGDRVGLFARSGPEWVLADLATLSAGAVNAPIFETSGADQLEFILQDCGARAVVVDDAERLQMVLDRQRALPALEWVIVLDEDTARPASAALRVLSILELETLGLGSGTEEVDRRVVALGRDDLLTFVYTSGTTGVPKGVMLTHGNMLANCEATARAVPVRSDDVMLSFLPLSHSFERMAGYYMASLFGGATIYYVEHPGRLFHNMAEVKPTLMTGVPRVYEKIYARFMATREQAHPLRRRLLDEALKVGLRVARRRQDGAPVGALLGLQYRLAYDQVFAPLVQRIGGRVRFFISGGAPLAQEVGEFFLAAGLLILEGYGLSEASPVVSVNRPAAFRFGTVGKPLDNVRVRVGEDGELFVRGPNVMRGYYNQPDESAAALHDGWLATGDIGEFTHDGFLKITDRKKDLFKTSTGKYIAPQMLERRLRALPFVEQACVVGDRRPYCVAFLVPAFEELESWAAGRGIPTEDRAALLNDPRVLRLVQRDVDRVNGGLERHETVKAFKLLAEPFTEGNGLLTPSMKVRRKAVYAAFAAEIDRLYGQGAHRHRWRRR